MAKRKRQAKSKSSNFLKFLFITGIIFMLFAGILKVSSRNNLSFASDLPSKEVNLTTSSPNKIFIPSVDISLEVFETSIINKDWEINENGASHLNTSANPGEGGNIILYAHNTKERFGSLKELEIGNIIKVYSANQKVYTYEVKNVKVVNTSEINLLLPTKEEILTIYTCTGFADLKRLIIQAEPISS